MVETTRFGKIEVQPEKTIRFEQGVIGFSDLKDYIILDHAPDSKFHWLQSIQRGDIAFPIANPDDFVKGYVISPPEELKISLGDFDPQDLFLGVIVTFPQGGGVATLNLKAPLVLNTKSRLGIQLVLDDPDAPIRFPIGK
jgi:flagellar assembly factor FliW